VAASMDVEMVNEIFYNNFQIENFTCILSDGNTRVELHPQGAQVHITTHLTPTLRVHSLCWLNGSRMCMNNNECASLVCISSPLLSSALLCSPLVWNAISHHMLWHALQRLVDSSNRKEWLALCLRKRLHESDEHMRCIRQGLAEIVPLHLFPLFTPVRCSVLCALCSVSFLSLLCFALLCSARITSLSCYLSLCIFLPCDVM